MIVRRPAGERGRGRFDWLDSRHTFSFGTYHDPDWMGFRTLRVLNEDRVAPGGGFAPHSHRDMEIVTWVLDGTLEHRDSLGNGSRLRPGDVQVMTAGTGITHSEYNADPDRPVHFLQTWLLPARHGTPPGWRERHVPPAERQGRLALLAAPDGTGDALAIGQDARVLTAVLDAGEIVTHTMAPGRHAWLQVARGTVRANDVVLAAGDGAAASEEVALAIQASERAEIVLFDLS